MRRVIYLLVVAAASAAEAQTKRPPTPADYGKWETLGNGVVQLDSVTNLRLGVDRQRELRSTVTPHVLRHIAKAHVGGAIEVAYHDIRATAIAARQRVATECEERALSTECERGDVIDRRHRAGTQINDAQLVVDGLFVLLEPFALLLRETDAVGEPLSVA